MLEAADDPENCEYPRGFDRYTSIDRVIDLQCDLERFVGRPFELEDRIFDSSSDDSPLYFRTLLTDPIRTLFGLSTDF